ncbi:MAG TPA: hypothetical protein VG253_24880 [Streptosporangiaceae bacterium]|nr:hypothetical protein [Streptosporangiaceae bacterium]
MNGQGTENAERPEIRRFMAALPAQRVAPRVRTAGPRRGDQHRPRGRALFGSSNPRGDIPRYLELYRLGQLKLDELVTREYRLEEINEGYQDMLEGRNIRGLIRF